jgi:hypothetical protein
MTGYRVIVEARRGTSKSPTSAQYTRSFQKVSAEKPEIKEEKDIKHHISPVLTVAKVGFVATKINGYVGELTENSVQQRRNQFVITNAGLVAGIIANPGLGLTVAGVYYGNAGIGYGIRIYKENLSAGYMRQLSNGTVKTGR